jgi:hypothetical protein
MQYKPIHASNRIQYKPIQTNTIQYKPIQRDYIEYKLYVLVCLEVSIQTNTNTSCRRDWLNYYGGGVASVARKLTRLVTCQIHHTACRFRQHSEFETQPQRLLHGGRFLHQIEWESKRATEG